MRSLVVFVMIFGLSSVGFAQDGTFHTLAPTNTVSIKTSKSDTRASVRYNRFETKGWLLGGELSALLEDEPKIGVAPSSSEKHQVGLMAGYVSLKEKRDRTYALCEHFVGSRALCTSSIPSCKDNRSVNACAINEALIQANSTTSQTKSNQPQAEQNQCGVKHSAGVSYKALVFACQVGHEQKNLAEFWKKIDKMKPPTPSPTSQVPLSEDRKWGDDIKLVKAAMGTGLAYVDVLALAGTLKVQGYHRAALIAEQLHAYLQKVKFNGERCEDAMQQFLLAMGSCERARVYEKSIKKKMDKFIQTKLTFLNVPQYTSGGWSLVLRLQGAWRNVFAVPGTRVEAIRTENETLAEADRVFPSQDEMDNLYDWGFRAMAAWNLYMGAYDVFTLQASYHYNRDHILGTQKSKQCGEPAVLPKSCKNVVFVDRQDTSHRFGLEAGFTSTFENRALYASKDGTTVYPALDARIGAHIQSYDAGGENLQPLTVRGQISGFIVPEFGSLGNALGLTLGLSYGDVIVGQSDGALRLKKRLNVDFSALAGVNF